MTQTIPGSAARNGVGDTPVTGESISGDRLVAKVLMAEGVGARRHPGLRRGESGPGTTNQTIDK